MAGIGRPGPIPKDPEERIRRNKTSEDGIGTSSYDLEGEVKVPEAYFVHPYVNDIWLSLKTSVNRKFYEPVDWAYAKLTLLLLDKALENGNMPRPTMLMTLDGMMSKMLANPADRRRLRIEADRSSNQKDGKVISAQQAFRDRFEKQRQVRA